MTIYFQKLRGQGPMDPAGAGYWNLWQKRQRPFEELAIGDRVILVRRKRKRPAEFAYDVTVGAPPLRTSYDTKAVAIKLIAEYLGVTRREVGDHEYTSRKEDHPGYVLAWSVGSARAIDIPVPDGFRLRPNGWFIAEDSVITDTWGL